MPQEHLTNPPPWGFFPEMPPPRFPVVQDYKPDLPREPVGHQAAEVEPPVEPQPADTTLPPALGRPDQEAAGASPEKQPRLTITGRVGTDYRLTTNPNGRAIGRFALGEHPHTEQTIWHQCVVFDELATRLQGNLVKGQTAQVVGYRHERQRGVGKDGTPRMVTELFVVAVRAR